MLPAPKPTNRRRTGFTIIELLVVIGIIIILMGILLPVVKKVRYAAYTADTQNEISQISNACSQYYSTFHAYPGPLPDSMIGTLTSTTSPITASSFQTYSLELYTSGATPPYSLLGTTYTFTGTENLVLGLLGGLRIDTAKGILALAPTEVGLGPLNLNYNPSTGQFLNPGRTPSFLTTGSTYLMWCQGATGSVTQSTTYQPSLTPNVFTDGSQTPANDSPIPEFVDRYPSPGPLPILYLRARIGAKGIVSDGTTAVVDPSTGLPANYEYDIRDIAAYTVPSASSFKKTTGIGLAGTISHNLQGVNSPAIVSTVGPPEILYNIKNNLPLNAGPYFYNSSIPPTDTSTDQNFNYTGRPRAVDTFILISAGPDGIYGTADDITSFGDVSQ